MRTIKFRAWSDFGNKMHHIKDDQYLFDFLREVDGMELMQFTGLYDKNGIEIYEGDVVYCYDHPTNMETKTGDVFMEDGCYRVRGSMIRLGDYGTVWIEVIGNIYETPELLNN